MMNQYSESDLLGIKLGVKSPTKQNIWDILYSIFFPDETSLSLIIPSTIYIRTNLLCEYIEEQVDVPFGIDNLLMILFNEFIQNSMKKYEPDTIYRQLNQSFGYGETLTVYDYQNNQETVFQKRSSNRTQIEISMKKKDVLKGELLLAEIDELYGRAFTIEKLITSLWMNFIEKYKKGENNRALQSIVKMLKKQSKPPTK